MLALTWLSNWDIITMHAGVSSCWKAIDSDFVSTYGQASKIESKSLDKTFSN